MAAFAALGVALFAVPLLRGPDGHGTEATMSSAAVAVPDGAPACSSAKGVANFDFTLKDTNGKKVRLSDYKGKVILLNFWATWCGPCKLEIPAFVEAYRQYRDRGFVILGVLSEDDPSADDLRTFMATFRMNYPVFKENVELGDVFGPLWALPTSFVIDRHGSICVSHTGAVSKEMLEREIKGLL
jgi:cytochrome c biogenesis protein CcmG/thiol:disulfide interchange protein DsbE